MQLTLKRPPIADTPYTISELFVDGAFFCHIFEDRDRGLYSTDTLQYIQSVKVKHETAIPYGTYQIVMSFSNRFQQFLPEILDVPGYSGIRIHSGTTEVDTSGCLLPGIKGIRKVVQSKVTTSKLNKEIARRCKKEKVFIDVVPANKA